MSTEQTETTTTDTETTTEAPATPEPATPETTEDKPTEFTEADREKLTGVVQKERQAAKAARTAAQAAEKRLAEMESAEVRRSVTAALELTPEQATFLTGDTVEEMTTSAEALLAAFGPKANPLRTRPVEKTKRTGATGRTEPVENMAAVADKVMD